MFRLTLLVTGLISFLYFAFPQSMPNSDKIGQVLGVVQSESLINLPTVETAVTIYCINHQQLPESLNILYENELSKQKYLDLDQNYVYSKFSGCDFKLSPKTNKN